MGQKKQNEIVRLCKKVAEEAISSNVLAPSAATETNLTSISKLLFGVNLKDPAKQVRRNDKAQMQNTAKSPFVVNAVRHYKAAQSNNDPGLGKSLLSQFYLARPLINI